MQISMDKRIRVPFYGSINLFIETLTGTYFKIQVSPSETILSIKAKIQRLEGIPISQQHLIWEGHELDDKMCLHEYRIPRDASIKLVTTLRGGPINTRKITTNDSSDYFDLSEDEFFDELPGSSEPDSQVTLLVYRNGDQINFFRVMDCGGKITPVSYHLRRQNSDSKPPSGVAKPRVTMSRIKENQITAAKMKKLQNKIKLLRLKDNASIDNSSAVHTEKASSSQDESTVEQSSGATSNNKSGLKLEPLKNVQTNEKSWRAPAKVSDSDKNGAPCDLSPKISFNRHEMYLRSYGLLPRHMDSASAEEEKPSLDRRSSLLPLNSADASHHIEGTNEFDESPTTSSNISRMTVREITSGRGPKTYSKRERVGIGQEEIAVLQEGHTKLPMISTHSSLTSTFANVNGIMSRSSSRNSKVLGVEGSTKDYAGLTHKSFGEKSNLTFKHPRKLTTLPLDNSEHLKFPRNDGCTSSTLKNEGIIPYPPNASAALLPPVRPFVIKKKRCFLCGKKTGLASSYLCRCGENFCASHRYAEAHACSFDYKATGRQVLKEANPVISSRKLPKI